MIETIEKFDTELFLYLNGFHNQILDVVMYYVSEGWFWAPVYLWILYVVKKKYGTKVFFVFIGGLGLSVLLSDRISVELFKEVFQRYRPCHNLDIREMVHTVNKCGGKFSFVSSHATNYFGVSVLTALFLRRRTATIWLLLWAGLIALSRVYLGVHYPADVSCGALLGTAIACVVFMLCKLVMSRMNLTLTQTF